MHCFPYAYRHIDEVKSSNDVAVFGVVSAAIVDILIDWRILISFDSGCSLDGPPEDRRLDDDGMAAFMPNCNYFNQVYRSNAETHEDHVTDCSQVSQFKSTFETLLQSVPRNDSGEAP